MLATFCYEALWFTCVITEDRRAILLAAALHLLLLDGWDGNGSTTSGIEAGSGGKASAYVGS